MGINEFELSVEKNRIAAITAMIEIAKEMHKYDESYTDAEYITVLNNLYEKLARCI